MPNFTILAPNGKKYKVSGPNREGAIEALNNTLNPKKDSSLGTALEFGKLNTYANTNDYVADLSEQFNNSGFANTLYDARNKIRGFFGAEPFDDATRDAATVAEQRKKVAELQDQRDALNYESLTSDSIKGPGSALYFGAQKVAESADGIAAALATGGTITPFLGAGEVNASLKEIEGLDPEKRVKLATGGGLVIAALENLGLGMLFKGMTPEVVGAMGVKKINSILTAKGLAQLPVKVVAAMATEGVTEGLQEGVVIGADALGGKEFKDNEIFERLKEASIAGAGAGGTIRTGTASVEGLNAQPFENTEQSRAATAFARRIKKIAEDNNHNLNDVGVKSTNGAREVVTKAHTQMAEELRVLFSDLKPLVAVNDQDTLADLEDKILAEAGRKEGKNLAKSQVGEQELNALDRLAGEFYEGQKARNLLLEMNELTALHKSGYKGGVSKITDMANPLNNLTHPFSSQGGLTGLATTGAAYMAGGGTGLAIQGGAFAGGRAIDAVTGRRSTVNKYIKDNTKSDRMTQLSPIGPSLREDRISQAEQQKMEELELNRSLDDMNAPPKGDINDPNPAPQFAMENATGLSKAGVAEALAKIEADGPLPMIQRAIDSYRKSVRESGTVTNLTQLIRLVKAKTMSDPLVQAQVINKPQSIPGETNTTNAKLDAEPQFGPRFTTQENYNRGIEANKKFNADQKTALNEVNNEGIMSESDYKTLSQAIDELDGNLGSKPLETFEAVYKKLEGVDPKLVQEIIDPMYERVTKQQRQRTVKTREGKTKEARVIKTIAEKQYRMSHRPNEDGAPISNMAQIFPDDIYSPNGIRYYGSAGVRGKADRESYDVIKKVKDNPEAEVTIYRAVPPGIKDINPGDWVSVSKTYAEDHAVFGYGPNGDQPGEIISQKVKASEIKSPGDDLNEYGYFPGIDKTVAQDPYEIEIQAAKDDYFSDPNNAEKRQNYLNLRSNRDNANGKTRSQLALPLFDSPLEIDGKVTVKKIGEAMNADHMQKHGRQFFPENNTEDYQQVYKYADAEISKQLEQPNSGVGWYSADVNQSMELASEVYPTLATDETHRKLYLTFAGIFSNGADPDNAFMMSAGAFDDFLRTGEVPVNRAEGFRQQGLEPPKTTFKDTRTKKKVTKDAGWGIRNQANEQQLGMLKYLSEREGGIQPALDFLLQPQSRADINALMLDSGLYKAGRFVTAKEKAGPDEYGFLAFGKKLGRYSLGLQGIDLDAGDTTIDLWYTRTFRRWTGRLLETPISKEGVAAQPANDAERESIFRMTGELADKYNLTPGDIQAVLWFFEKRTWGSQGLKTKEGTNSSGARKLLKERGVVPTETAAFNPNDGTRSDGSNPSVSPTNEPGATRQGILGQFFGGGQRNAAPKNNDRSQPVSEAEIRAQIPVVQAVFEIDKEGSEYENGIRDFDAILNVAKAYSIIPKLYRSFKDMEKADPTITEGALGAYNPNNREAMAIMPGGIDAFGGTVSGLASLSYMVHEVAHGIAGSDINTNQFMGDKFVFNYLTNQDDTAGINSLEAVFGDLVNTPNDARSQNKIIAEMLAVQKNLTFKDPDTGQVLPLRQTKSLMDSYNAGQRRAKAQGVRSEQFNKDVKAFEKQIIDQRNYEQSIPELTVNALQVAMMHPKIMKKVAPNTYKLLKHLFDNSKNKSGIKFFNHSLAMAVAVLLAMMARGEEPPEEQSLPPGALSPAPGILAA